MSKPHLETTCSLTATQEQVLHEQVIDESQPGTILRDFQTLLEFVGTDGIETAGKHHLLPMGCLSELNGQLRSPLELRLKRPQQRSYPNLEGLYLLLRATDLGVVEGPRSKTKLVIDPSVLESWMSLNPTDRYFTLLEAWLLGARSEMLGHSANFMGREYVYRLVEFFQMLSIFAATRGGLDEFPTSAARKFEEEFLAFIRARHGDLRDKLEQSKEMDKDTQEQLMQALDEFKTTFTA